MKPLTNKLRGLVLGCIVISSVGCASGGGAGPQPLVVPAAGSVLGGQNPEGFAAVIRERFPDSFTASRWDAGTTTLSILLLPESVEPARLLALADPHSFDVKIVPSMFSLNVLEAKLSRIVDSELFLPVAFSGGINVLDQTIELSVDVQDPGLLRAANQLADPVTVVWSGEPRASLF